MERRANRAVVSSTGWMPKVGNCKNRHFSAFSNLCNLCNLRNLRNLCKLYFAHTHTPSLPKIGAKWRDFFRLEHQMVRILKNQEPARFKKWATVMHQHNLLS